MSVVTPPTPAVVAVGLGELRTATDGELVAYSLGSCVGICLYDPIACVAGMAHVVLPSGVSPSSASGSARMPGKYADTVVPALVDALVRLGASPGLLQCKIVGGAAVLAIGGAGSLPNVGQRNVEAVKAALATARIRVLAEETGGHQGRTVRLSAATGRVHVRTVRGTEEEL